MLYRITFVDTDIFHVTIDTLDVVTGISGVAIDTSGVV